MTQCTSVFLLFFFVLWQGTCCHEMYLKQKKNRFCKGVHGQWREKKKCESRSDLIATATAKRGGIEIGAEELDWRGVTQHLRASRSRRQTFRGLRTVGSCTVEGKRSSTWQIDPHRGLDLWPLPPRRHNAGKSNTIRLTAFSPNTASSSCTYAGAPSRSQQPALFTFSIKRPVVRHSDAAWCRFNSSLL